LVSKKDFSKIEPNIKAELALYSPTTGIVDSHSFMQSLEANATNNTVTFAYNHQVFGIEKTSESYYLNVKSGDEIFQISGNIIFNSAGLNSDKIAEMAGIDIDKENYRLAFAKGHYFRLAPSKNHISKHLIYPAPQKNWTGIGIHITHDLAGSIKFGPDIQYMPQKILDYSFNKDIHQKFFDSINRYAPDVNFNDIVPDQVGIRPKLQKEGEGFRDFIIQEETEIGLPNFWNLIGIESPGLTASLAIAKYISTQILL
jgi:L-2-hydroxyglutarate oxidase LhgO